MEKIIRSLREALPDAIGGILATTFLFIVGLLAERLLVDFQAFIIIFIVAIWITLASFAFAKTKSQILSRNNATVHRWKYPRFRPWAIKGLLIIPITLILWLGFNKYGYLQIIFPSDTYSDVVILVSRFDGPEPKKYRVTETVWEKLNLALDAYDDVQLILLNGKSITTQVDAEALGKEHKADIVIWGWYGMTDEKVIVSSHFQVLELPEKARSQLDNQEPLRYYQVMDIENYFMQEYLSQELTSLSLFTIGMLRFVTEDWDAALLSFQDALDYSKDEENITAILSYIDIAESNLPVTLIKIVVITQPLQRGTLIDSSHVTTVEIPSRVPIPGMFENCEDVIGKRIRFDLDTGIPITESMLVHTAEPLSYPGSIASLLIPPGKVAVSIPIQRLASVSWVGDSMWYFLLFSDSPQDGWDVYINKNQPEGDYPIR